MYRIIKANKYCFKTRTAKLRDIKVSLKKGFSETNKYSIETSDCDGSMRSYYKTLREALNRFYFLIETYSE